jgi:glycerol-3-phosphate dehydrogenase
LGDVNRDTGLARLTTERFDILVIGGGATGLGCAVDAASRGYHTALIEAADFACATSSRSTKLVHGGVRYLQQGNIALVREALTERAHLVRNAPGMVRELPFLVPVYTWHELPYYAIGLRLYDMLGAGNGPHRSRIYGRSDARSRFPSLAKRALRGGLLYWDAQFDDARLAVTLAQTAVDHGAAIANYVRAQALLYEGSRICGASAIDCESGERFEIRASAVINATGIFADELRERDRPAVAPLLTFSRGSHIVVSSQALPISQTALLVPRTSDRRVVFAIPWHGCVLIGTTDVVAPAAVADPHATMAEIDYLLATINRYVDRPLERADIQSAWAGLRPLVNRAAVQTSRLSREHFVETAPSGLVSVTGGKWTTYRKMAQDAVEAAALSAGLAKSTCRTTALPLHEIPLEPRLEDAVEREMARTIEDLLARRRRTLFIDPNAARGRASEAADILARGLHRSPAWREEQLRGFATVAAQYAPGGIV